LDSVSRFNRGNLDAKMGDLQPGSAHASEVMCGFSRF
jgi:hypothetical protein